MTAVDALLGIGLLIAVGTDLSTGKIPNGLTIPLALAGLALHAISGSLVFSLVGFGVAFAIHFGLWALRVIKGGDAKLMMAVGALVGWQEMFEASLWMFVLLLPLGLARLAAVGRLGNLVRHLRWQIANIRSRDAGEEPPLTHMVFGGVIAPAVLAARFTTWFDLF